MLGGRQYSALTVCLGLLVASLVFVPAHTAAAAAAGQSALTPSLARAFAVNVTDKVIVVLKDQETAIPDTAADQNVRAAAIESLQRPLISELKMTDALDVNSDPLIDAVSATVSPREAQRLKANPEVAEVLPDEAIRIAPTSPPSNGAASTASIPLPGVCAPPGQVQLNPEAVVDIHAATQSSAGSSAQALGYTGAGVKVAYLADGIDVNNPDFIRPDGQHVFVDYQDFSNDGSGGRTDGGAEAYIDASSIAAQGLHTYNVNGYGLTTFNRQCLIRILGVAPGASLVGLDVFGLDDETFESEIVSAMNYAVDVDHVDVINESLGENPIPDETGLDAVKMANDAAVAAGVTVTVGAGDAGQGNTLEVPATDPKVIDVGASTTYRSYLQVGYPTAVESQHVKGWLDNNISGLSSSGFTQDGATVDVVAPGDENWMLCTPNLRRFGDCWNFAGKAVPVLLDGGTSESAPLTAGVAALVIQAYEEAHRGSHPSPAVVKQIITSTAEDIGAPSDMQGAGLVDAYQAVLAAKSYPGTSSSPTGGAILSSVSQLNASGQPGASNSFSDTITNYGVHRVTVALSTRTLGAYRSVAHTTVRLNRTTGSAPAVHFNVPAGVAQLDALFAYVGAGADFDYSAIVDMSLIDSNGKFAEFTLQQGVSNHGDAEVANPVAGQWTALIDDYYPASQGGSTGPIVFGARIANWVPFGHLSTTSVTLSPGAAHVVRLTASNPAAPGDQAGAIVLDSDASEPPFASVTTVPVTLRALVPTPAPTTRFTGTLTGGNGRNENDAQTAFYQVQIPAGLPVLDAQITMRTSANPFMAELIDPITGEAASTTANALYRIDKKGRPDPIPKDGADLHVLNPDSGLWTLIIAFYNQVSGTALSQPFTVALSRAAPEVRTNGIPGSTDTHLAAAHAVSGSITVTNNSQVAEEYFVDSRLNQPTVYSLAAQGKAAVQVPIRGGVPPDYLVPGHTTSITVDVTARVPLYFDYWWYFGDPDLTSTPSSPTENPSGTFDSQSVVGGQWFITPYQAGPGGKTPLPPERAVTAMNATTLAFDPAATSPTGDFWLQSIDPSSAFDPEVVDPGQTVSIPVTFLPSGATGTTVTGTLFLEETAIAAGDPGEAGGGQPPFAVSDVAAVPYEYSIK